MNNENKTPLQKFVELDENLSVEFNLADEKPPQPSIWKEIDGLSFPEDRWVVKKLRPREGVTIFASVSGEGKSLLIMHLAKCISEGSPWFGCEGLKTKKARVLYINLEMSISEIQRRGRKISFDPYNQNLIILNEDNFNLNEGTGRDDLKFRWLLKCIYTYKVEVVIIDTFRAVSGGLQENDAEKVRAFYQKFMILKNSGISLIVLEHMRKPSHLEGKVPKKEAVLGSQDKTANAESLLMIYKHEASGNIHVYQRKNRLGEETKPFAVKISDVIDSGGTERIEFQYVGEIDEDVNKKDESKRLVLEILVDKVARDRKELGELVKKQVGDKNLRAGLADLLETGELDYFKQGKKFMYFIPTEKPVEPKESIDSNKDENFS